MMAGSALVHAISSITKFGRTDSKPIVDDWLVRPAEINCNNSSAKQSRLEVIHEAIEEGEGDGPPSLLQAKSQSEPVKITQFARPTICHEDPIDGFIFMKPQIPHMNFSRKTVRNSSIPIESNPSQILPLHQTTNASDSTVSLKLQGDTLSATSPQDAMVHTHDEISQEPPLIRDQRVHGVSNEPQSPKIAFERCDIPGAGDVSNNVETDAAPDVQPQIPKIFDQVSEKVNQKSIEVPSKANISEPTSQVSQTKINKAPKRPQILAENKPSATLQSADLNAFLNEEDLLSALLLHHRREQKQKEALRAVQHAKDMELEDLRDVSNDLYRQLQCASGENKAKEMELSKIYSAIPEWEAKVQRLKEHVKNLASEHQELRKGANELWKRHAIIQAENSALNTSLEEVRENMDRDRSRSKKVLHEAKHQMEFLEQTISNQQIQLQEDCDLLDAERARSHRLETEISEITKSHLELAKLFTEHRDVVAHKLNDLLEKGNIAQLMDMHNSRDDLKLLLDECFQMLKKIQNVDTVKPQDLQNLDTSVRGYANGLTQSIQSCSRISELTREGQRSFSMELQRQLYELKSNVKAEQTLNEQLMDVREMKATVRERLQATESALVEARQHAITLEHKEQLHIQKISELELEVGRISTKISESPALISQIRELDNQNKDLQEQVATCHIQSNTLSEQLQQKVDDVSKLEACVKDLELHLANAHIESSTFEDKRIAYESQGVERLEQLRKQLSRSATLEQDRLEGNYLNQIKQLRQQKSMIEEKAEQWKRQLSRLQGEKDEIDIVAKERLHSLTRSLAEQNAKDTEAFQSQIAKLESKVEQGTQYLQETQVELESTMAKLKTKETEILKLTSISVLKVNANAGLANADSFEQKKRMINRSNGRRKIAIEDSQPSRTESQARETSPLSSLDDLSGLFPPTPVQGFHDSDVSQNAKAVNSGSSLNSPNKVPPIKHLTFAAGTFGGESPQQLNHDSDQLPERKTPSMPSKATFRFHELGGHNSISSPRHQSDASVRSPEHSLQRPTAKFGKSSKRKVEAAGFDEEISQTKDFDSHSCRGLGPVIADSQNSNGSRVITARKSKVPKIAARKSSKDDKYTRRFLRELD